MKVAIVDFPPQNLTYKQVGKIYEAEDNVSL